MSYRGIRGRANFQPTTQSKTYGLQSAMDEFAAERWAQIIVHSVRIGPRNQPLQYVRAARAALFPWLGNCAGFHFAARIAFTFFSAVAAR